MEDEKIKHLEMTQDTIKRMASNSFYIKGWTVTLVSAMIAVMIREDKTFYLFITFMPVITFWALDAYFLREEKLFRCLYNDICKKNNNDIDFLMNTSAYDSCVETITGVFFSKTLITFYGGIIFTVTAIIVLIA